jgi:hypothetical protein
MIRLSQSKKADVPILATLIGMIIEFKLVHPSKAYLPIWVTLLGIVILFILTQSKNAQSPILTKLFDNLTSCRAVQP